MPRRLKRGIAQLLSGTVEQIPFEDEFFDKAYAMNSFHLWADKIAGLSEVRRVLKPGGRLALSFYGPAKQAITRESVLELLGRAGFEEVASTEGRDSVLYITALK